MLSLWDLKRLKLAVRIASAASSTGVFGYLRIVVSSIEPYKAIGAQAQEFSGPFRLVNGL